MLDELAHRVARQAHAMFRPDLPQPALLAEAAMRVYMLAKTGRMAAVGDIVAAAILRIGRVWQNGTAQPAEVLELYRKSAEASVLVRAVHLERQSLPELDKQGRRLQLRRYHDRIRQCRRRQVATAWGPLGHLEDIGRELAGY